MNKLTVLWSLKYSSAENQEASCLTLQHTVLLSYSIRQSCRPELRYSLLVFHERAVESWGSNPATSRRLTREIQTSVLHSFHLQQRICKASPSLHTFDLPAGRAATAFSLLSTKKHLQIKGCMVFLWQKKWIHSRNHHLLGEGNRYVPSSARSSETPPAHCKGHQFCYQQLPSTDCGLEKINSIKNDSSCHSH